MNPTPQPNQQEIQSQFRDNLDHVRLIKKDGTTVSVAVLLQTAITEAKREMVAIIGDDEPTNNLMALSYLSRNNLRAEQRQALNKLTNEIAEDEPK